MSSGFIGSEHSPEDSCKEYAILNKCLIDIRIVSIPIIYSVLSFSVNSVDLQYLHLSFFSDSLIGIIKLHFLHDIALDEISDVTSFCVMHFGQLIFSFFAFIAEASFTQEVHILLKILSGSTLSIFAISVLEYLERIILVSSKSFSFLSI